MNQELRKKYKALKQNFAIGKVFEFIVCYIKIVLQFTKIYFHNS